MTAFFKDGAGTEPADNPTEVNRSLNGPTFSLPLTFKNTSGGTVNTFSLTQGTYATIAWDDTPPISLANNGTTNVTVTVPTTTAIAGESDTVQVITSGGTATLNLTITVTASGGSSNRARMRVRARIGPF